MGNAGEIIKQSRLEKGLTQQELGDLSGVSKHSIIKYEKNEREPNLETLTKIINILDLDFWDIAPIDKIELEPSGPYEEGQRFFEEVMARIHNRKKRVQITYETDEIRKLSKLLSNKQICRITGEFLDASKQLSNMFLKDKDYATKDELMESKLKTFEKEYYLNIYNAVNGVINSSINELKNDIKRYINSKEISKVTETILFVKEIFERKNIKYAVLDECIKSIEEPSEIEDIKIIVSREQEDMVFEMMDIIAEKIEEGIYKLNKVTLSFEVSVTVDDVKYYLEEQNIKHCVINGEKVLVSTIETC